MKRLSVISLVVVIALLVSVFVFAPASSSMSKSGAHIDQNKVAAAKIENLLNLNNVFDDDFTDNEKLINKAAINLKSYTDDDGFIPEAIVISYIKDMYDIDMVITESHNSSLPHKNGYVYLIPRGYTTYKHNILSIEEADDYITVTSSVFIAYHDNESCIGTAKTVLVRNPASSFGYNIINSEISYDIQTKQI